MFLPLSAFKQIIITFTFCFATRIIAMTYRILKLSALVFLFLSYVQSFSQISSGGVPPGFNQADKDQLLETCHIPAPDIELLLKEDEINSKQGVAERVGVLLPVGINPTVNGKWSSLQDGRKQWRVKITSEGAQGLSLYFSDFYLPVGSELYVYNESRTRLIGAFTDANNHESGLFASELVSGNSLIVELLLIPEAISRLRISISEVLFAYNYDTAGFKQFGKSGACNVNVNCSEGSNWQDQKKGVMKIHTKVGNQIYRCSGSLINNTNYDFLPYVYTADHCARNNSGQYSSADDYNQWVFFFNYESETCENPAEEPSHISMIGSTLKANVGGGNTHMGSDFCLVLLNDDVPPAIRPFYNGWSRSGDASPSGVCIHHPSGDVKKISTYKEPLQTASWNVNTQNMYWLVRWGETENGHGVTEGGSSGSPIFSNDGFIVGQLTGGQASCAQLTAPDYYGKFSVSWEAIGSSPEKQLKFWLDPKGTGVETLRGAYNELQVIAEFTAEPAMIQKGGSVRFFDSSIGDPDEWHWFFDGGEPSEQSGRNAGPITYNRLGKFDVKLVAKNELYSDTVVREKYVQVVPGLFPNPATERITLLLGSHDEEKLVLEVVDMAGRSRGSYEYNINGVYSIDLDINHLEDGVYIISAAAGDELVSKNRLIVARP